MFEFVQNNKLIIKIILVTIGLTFIGFGIGSYSTMVDDAFLANVDGTKIYKQDLDRAMESQSANVADRQATLDGLINRELVLADAHHSGLVVSTSQLQQAILAIPEFQEKGTFSEEKYRTFLKSRYMTAESFQQRLSRDILLQVQLAPFLQGQITSHSVVDRVAAILSESREVSTFVLKPSALANEIKTDEATLKAYFAAHPQRFKVPETVKLDYVVLSQDQLAQGIQVSDVELADYYNKHKAEFNREERQAAHILLMLPQGSTPEEKAKIRARAQVIATEARADPSRFAALAQQYSQDVGSAKRGGDLGFFAQGAMVKPFDDAVFHMKVGQVSDVVETPFGYHIIKLDGIRTPDMAALKPQLLERIQGQKAATMFRQMAEKLSELAYQHSDSLKPIQEALKLPVLHSDWISRTKPGEDMRLANPLVLDAALSDDVLKKKHNSEPIDLGHNTLLVLRVTAYQPAHTQVFNEVKDQIKNDIIAAEGAKITAKRGQEQVAALQAGKMGATLAWGQSQTVSRRAPGAIPYKDMRAIFAVNGNKLPGFTGIARDDGEYVIYRVEKKTALPAPTGDERKQLNTLLTQINTNAQIDSYLKYLMKKYPVTTRRQALDGQ